MCGIVACWSPKGNGTGPGKGKGGDHDGKEAAELQQSRAEVTLARMQARGPDGSAWRRYGASDGEGGRHLLGARRLVVRGGAGAAAAQPLEASVAGGSGAGGARFALVMNGEVYDTPDDCSAALRLWAQAAASAPTSTTATATVTTSSSTPSSTTPARPDRVHGDGDTDTVGERAKELLNTLASTGSEFALAMVDESVGIMLCARDPFGVKPLYLAGPHTLFCTFSLQLDEQSVP